MTNRDAAKEALHDFALSYRTTKAELKDEKLDWVLDKIAEYVISQIKMNVREEGWDHVGRPRFIISAGRREDHDT